MLSHRAPHHTEFVKALSVQSRGFNCLGIKRVTAGNLDPAGLQRFGDLAHKVDVQHAVGMGRAGDAHVVGQVEPAFKRAGGS